MNVYEKLMVIQSNLKAPKSNFNSFGKYNYRSCEDILEGVKEHLKEVKAVLILNDNVEQAGERFYIKATATLVDAEKGDKIEVSAYAREDETKKGMDLSQVTGSTSSYARKYALNGLFCIDDTKDSDATNTHDKTNTEATGGQQNDKMTNNALSEKQVARAIAIGKKAGVDIATIKKQILKDYNATDISHLTKVQYDELCARLEKAGVKSA